MASAPALRRLSTATAASISVSKAKSKLRSEFDPDKALKILTSAFPSDTSSPSSSRYAQDVTVRRLAKSGRFSDIESLVEAHKADPRIKEEAFLCTLIRSYGLAGMFDHALRTYHQMDRFGTPRSALSLNALLIACNQTKNYARVPELFREMREKFRVSPDEVSYGALVKSYCSLGEVDKAVETIGEMEKGGLRVGTVTFSTLLSCLYKLGRVEEAESLWAEMVAKGVELDVVAYNVRLMHAQDIGDVKRVNELIVEMEVSGLKPDTVSYNYAMNCYCKCGMMKEAERVYEGLERWGCNPNAMTFRTLISYLCKDGDFEAAYKVFKKSVENHKMPGFDLLEQLVRGLVAKNKIKEAKGLIRTAKKRLSPSSLKAWEVVVNSLPLRSANGVASGILEDDADDKDATI